MSAPNALVADAVRDGERTLLLSPEVGWFTCALPKGRVVVAGQEIGRIRTLGVSRPLLVPEGVRGRLAGGTPERVHAPVAFGEALYALEPVGEDDRQAAEAEAEAGTSDLVVRSPHDGRFWHRPAPGEAPLVEAGGELEAGQSVGLLEVMKTFTHVTYRAGGGLPPRARVVRMLLDDGAEAREGQPLLEVEPA